MWIKITLIFGLLTLCLAILQRAYKLGRKVEQLERLKKEIKERAEEQAYAQSKLDFVRNLSDDDVSARLSKIGAGKK